MESPNAVCYLSKGRKAYRIPPHFFVAKILKGNAHRADRYVLNSIIPKSIFSIPERRTIAEGVFFFIINCFMKKVYIDTQSAKLLIF